MDEGRGQSRLWPNQIWINTQFSFRQGCNLGYESLAVLIPNTQALWKRGFSLAEKLRDTKAEPVHDASVVEMRLSPFQSTSRPRTHAYCVYEPMRGEVLQQPCETHVQQTSQQARQ
jgi:hypothetical protein